MLPILQADLALQLQLHLQHDTLRWHSFEDLACTQCLQKSALRNASFGDLAYTMLQVDQLLSEVPQQH